MNARYILVLLVMATLSALLTTACNSGGDASDIADELADLLTDSLDFDNGDVKETPPPEADDNPLTAPVIQSLQAPAALTLGETFSVTIQSAYSGQDEVVSAVFQVLDRPRHIAVSGRLSGGSLVLTGALAIQDRLRGIVAPISVQLVTASGKAGKVATWMLTVRDEDPMSSDALSSLKVPDETWNSSGRPGGSADDGAPQITSIQAPSSVAAGSTESVVLQAEAFSGSIAAVIISTPGNGAYKRSTSFDVSGMKEQGPRITLTLDLQLEQFVGTSLVFLFALESAQGTVGLYVPWFVTITAPAETDGDEAEAETVDEPELEPEAVEVDEEPVADEPEVEEMEEVNLCDPDPCNGHGVCKPADGSCQCDDSFGGDNCDQCAEGYTEYPACFPWPPLDPWYTTETCDLPACDEQGSVSFDASGLWIRMLTTVESDCEPMVMYGDSRVGVANVDVAAPIPLGLIGTCAHDPDTTEPVTGVYHGDTGIYCVVRPDENWDILRVETSVLKHAGSTAVGTATIYLSGMPYEINDCHVVFDVLVRRIESDPCPESPCNGRGICDPETGTCQCGTGYVGEYCDGCAEGYAGMELNSYCLPDRDGDGIPENGDRIALPESSYVCNQDNLQSCDDNCPDLYNPDQMDSDYNNLGDACDPGFVDGDADTEEAEEELESDLRCANGVCYDPASGLSWQQEPGSETWDNAVTYCQNLVLDGGGWRLPNISELRSLVRNCPDIQAGGACGVATTCLEYSCWSNANCQPSSCVDNASTADCYWPVELGGTCMAYWSSSEPLSTSAWYVTFEMGYVYDAEKTYTNGVRCVR